MTSPLFIVGAGGFGREVFSIPEALNGTGSVLDIAARHLLGLRKMRVTHRDPVCEG